MSGFFGRFARRFGFEGSASSEADSSASENRAQNESLLFRASGTFYTKRPEKEVYNPVTDQGAATIELIMDAGAAPAIAIFLVVRDREGAEDELLRLPLTNSGDMTYHHPTIMWPCIVEQRVIHCAFNVVAEGDAKAVSERFISLYCLCVYAVIKQEPPVLEEDPDDDVRFVSRAYAHRDADDDGDSAATAEPQPRPPPPPSSQPVATSRRARSVRDAKYTWVADAFTHQRVLAALDGGRFEVHAYDPATPVATLQVRTTKHGLDLPTDVVLTHGESKAAMLPAGRGSACVSQVDLETGKADELLPGLEYKLSALTLANGRDQAANPHLLVVSNSQAAFQLDTRLDPKACAVVESGKNLTDYTHVARSSQHFLCHATSSQGHVAIGDRAGQIRLFSGPPGALKPGGKGHQPKTAKTLISVSAGEPITAIDITADGKYVLATCAQCLLVISTEMSDGSLGFTSRMGAEKPPPVRLAVPPEVVAAVGRDFTLTKASFGTDRATGEHVITSSVGPYLLVWDAKQVFSGVKSHTGARCEAVDVGMRPRYLTSAHADHIVAMADDSVAVAPLPRPAKRGKTFARFA